MDLNNHIYQNLCIRLDLLSVVPGCEETVSRAIHPTNANEAIFYSLGTHDLAKLTVSDVSVQQIKVYKDILDYCYFIGSPFSAAHNGNDVAPTLSKIINSPLVAVVLLKLSAHHSFQYGIERTIALTAQLFSTMVAIPVRYHGQREVGILVGVDSGDIRKLFESIGLLRSDSAFSSTSTLLLVKHFVDGRLPILQGAVTADVRIACPPLAETILRQTFSKNSIFSCRETLGSHDLTIHTKNEIDLSTLLSEVLDLRKKLPGGTVLSISTQLGWVTNIADHSPRTVETEYDDHDHIKETLDNCFKWLTQIESHASNRFESNQIRTFVMKVGAALYNPLVANQIEMLWPLLNFQFLPLLETYAEELSNGRDTVQSEKDIFTLVHYGSGSLAQLLSPGLQPQFPFGLPEGYYGGVNAIIVAAWKFIKSLYGKAEGADAEWSGAVFFSQFHNFGLYPFEIVSLSEESLEKPINRDTNWLTVTHEVSHSYWARFDVFEHKGLEVGQKGKRPRKIGIIEIANGEGEQYGYDKPGESIGDFKDMLWEWFAHWFDYKHFYAGKIDLYLWGIWSSWLRLPLVRQNLREYFIRTFVIFLVDKGLKLMPVWKKGKECQIRRRYLGEQYDLMLKKLEGLMPLGYRGEYRTQAQAYKTDIVSMFTGNNYIALIGYFELHFRRPEMDSPDFTEKPITEKVEAILNGQSLCNETHVLGIMLGLMDHFRRKKKDPDIKVTMALLDTLLLSR